MSEIAQVSVRQQLQILKEQTRLTGGLHEAQVLQLKMWPLTLFEAQTSSFTWDPDKKTVSFSITLEGSKEPIKDAQTRVAVLNSWIQEILGDEWLAQVTFEGKVPVTMAGKRKISGTEPRTQP